MKSAALLPLILLSSTPLLVAGEIDADLESKLEQADPNEVISVIVYLSDRVDLDTMTQQLNTQQVPLKTRHEVVVTSLRDKAQETQAPVIEYLDQLKDDGRIESFEAFWVSNLVRLDAVPDEIMMLAEREDVDRIYFNYPIELIYPVAEGPSQSGQRSAAGSGPEPGVVAVRAPEVWDLGITGEGVLVATLDTGVDGNHPALASRWRGLDPAYVGHPEWAFFDPVTNWQFPQDSGDHGTHTMGTVCGGAPGNQVGVAPGAQWIHAAVIDRVSIQQTISDAILAFQWLIDPDGDAGTDFDVPDVCSNSWGLADFHGTPDCDETFWEFLDACEAAGIVIAFSAGNEGTGGLRRPADRATDDYRTFAVAAVDANLPGYPIAGFSSRGPTFCTPGGGAATKPDIAAPGVDVVSSLPGGGYGPKDGTSMASPHINGVVALMRQANPEITPDQVKQIIYETAFDLGSPGEDNDYGWGIVDAFEAVTSALGTATLTFEFPDGFPEFVDPNGGTAIHVIVSSVNSQPVSGSGMLYYNIDGGEYIEIAMQEDSPNDYQAIFPAFDCGDNVAYYFSADTEEGDTVFSPFSAPSSTYSAQAYTGLDIFFEDDFESHLGWSVVDSGGLTSGTWQRGVPAGGGDRGDPASDADGSGNCYVTGIADGDNDVDNGATTLFSPVMDATDPDAMLSYYRWYSNSTGGAPSEDTFVVDVSSDGGFSWWELEVVGPSGPEVNGGWIHKEWLIADIPNVNNTGFFRVRFEASDLGDGSIVEAGVDGVLISKLSCDSTGCPNDLNGDGSVGVEDLLDLIAAWGTPDGDVNGDGTTDVNDMLELLAAWGPC